MAKRVTRCKPCNDTSATLWSAVFEPVEKLGKQAETQFPSERVTLKQTLITQTCQLYRLDEIRTGDPVAWVTCICINLRLECSV